MTSAGLPFLSPLRRDMLMNLVRPPAGFRLDCAVGTSFSLDLRSALILPIALALLETEEAGEEGLDGNGLPVLVAAQTHARKLAIYCERGRIAACEKVPAAMVYLEGSIHQVMPPDRGCFHPKLWVLRFVDQKSAATCHRVLCLSRNLTFARSWDSALCLEQSPQADPAQAKPLIRFLRMLDSSSPSEQAKSLAKSLRNVGFLPPPGFTGLTLRPFLPGRRDRVLDGGGRRLLVISPFLSDERLRELGDAWGRVDVVSSPESLDALQAGTHERLGTAYAFEPIEWLEGRDPIPSRDERLGDELRLGDLHAKLFLGEVDGEARVLTGSPNATTAAFRDNVEFAVELVGPKKAFGPAAVLQERSDHAGFASLLFEHRPQPAESAPEGLELERLDGIRRSLAALELTARCTRMGGREAWTIVLAAAGALPAMKKGDRLECWPITLSRQLRRRVSPARELARFTVHDALRITPLFAFRLRGGGRDPQEIGFTLEAALEGDVPERRDRVIEDVLRDPGRLLRFLLLLLACGSDDTAATLASGLGTTDRQPAAEDRGVELGIPLFETMARTFAREPARLGAVQELIPHLRAARERGVEVPDGLLEMWEPFEAALSGRGS